VYIFFSVYCIDLKVVIGTHQVDEVFMLKLKKICFSGKDPSEY
jgi:hypothetical protein